MSSLRESFFSSLRAAGAEDKVITVTQEAAVFETDIEDIVKGITLGSEESASDLFTITSTYPYTITYNSEGNLFMGDDAPETPNPAGDSIEIMALEENTGEERLLGNIDIYCELLDITINIPVKQAAAGAVIEPILIEEFDNSSTSDSSTEITNKTFPNFNGTTSKAYASKYGGIKFGSGSAAGYITSKSLDLSKAFKVSINVLKYSKDEGVVQVTVGETTQEITPTASDTKYTLYFDAATSTSTIKIGTSSKRAYIDNVVVEYK